MARFMTLVTEIRTIRSTYEVDPKRRIDVTIVAREAADRSFVEAFAPLVRPLARVERLEIAGAAGKAPREIQHPVGSLEVRIPMAGLFDVEAEQARLRKEESKADAELASLRKRLENPDFVSRAKPEVVAGSRQRVAELEERLVRVRRVLDELAG
jgi:valyl-tRNA synthetase